MADRKKNMGIEGQPKRQTYKKTNSQAERQTDKEKDRQTKK